MSRPLSSPSEGDDPCGINVTHALVHGVTLLIGLCGLAGNGAVLRLMSLKPTFADYFDLAVADFLFLLFTVPSALLLLLDSTSCSAVVHPVYLDFLFQLSLVDYYWGLYRLTGMRIANGLYVLCLHCWRRRLPERLLLVMHNAEYLAFFTLFTVIPTVTSLCPAHEQEQCRAALISINCIILLLCAAPVAFSGAILVKDKRGSQQQQQQLKNLHMVTFLILLFTLVLSLWNFLQQLGYTPVYYPVVFLLACSNSTIRPFIYFSVGRCRRPCSMGSLRKSLQRVFEDPEGNTPSSNDAAMDTAI